MIAFKPWGRTALIFLFSIAFNACTSPKKKLVKPVITTEKARYDTDDPAIWVNIKDPSKSIVFGTDKGGDDPTGGSLLAYDLRGKIIEEKSITGLNRPNNVDLEYNVEVGGKTTDIVVLTERGKNQIRIFSVPSMKALDGGGIAVFKGESDEMRRPMGIALFKAPEDGSIFCIVSRKNGPSGSYLWQYLLKEKDGILVAELVRKFGKFEGDEIEAIAVDDKLGYVYYSDEGVGVRKYYAHPKNGDQELACFGKGDFIKDNEGISIYSGKEGKGYILVSDQQANRFHIYDRMGDKDAPHKHRIIKTVFTSTIESDGSDITSLPLDGLFSNGLFVAMSDDKTFQFYRWEDIAGESLLEE